MHLIQIYLGGFYLEANWHALIFRSPIFTGKRSPVRDRRTDGQARSVVRPVIFTFLLPLFLLVNNNYYLTKSGHALLDINTLSTRKVRPVGRRWSRFLSLSQTLVYTARPRIRSLCIEWCVCLSSIFTGTHCAYPRRNGQAELTWVAANSDGHPSKY